VNGQRAATVAEFAELALGVDWLLWDGPDDESETERAARLTAARDIVADMWSADPEVARQADELISALWETDPAAAVCAQLLADSVAPTAVPTLAPVYEMREAA